MFERFTDRARRVTVLAQDEARRLGHDRIGTEHILLAVAREGTGVGARTLEFLGISRDAVRERVEDAVGHGPGTPQGHLRFTDEAKKALELSLREALQMGCNYIGSEHILLGLVHEGEGVAAQVMTGLGTDLSHVRQAAIEVRDEGRQHGGATRTARAPGRAGKKRADKKDRRTRRQLREFGSRLESIDQRLTALEQRVGVGPDLGDLEPRITEVRRAKQLAIDSQEFEDAAVLRDDEKNLLAEVAGRRVEWQTQYAHLPSLSTEIARLRDLLRQHGIDPKDGAA